MIEDVWITEDEEVVPKVFVKEHLPGKCIPIIKVKKILWDIQYQNCDNPKKRGEYEVCCNVCIHCKIVNEHLRKLTQLQSQR